jgi:hypothetical protein
VRFLFLVAIGLLLVGCHHRQPKVSEAKILAIRASEPGMTDECLNKIRWGGIPATPTAVDQCFKMQPARRWRGVWRNEFEGSRFCPAPATKCSFYSPGDRIWLDAPKHPDHTLYAVDFIGRRTAVKGHYGHMGVFDHELIVDRMIAMRQLEAPTKGYATE